jgi:hypothetical protein
MIKVRWTIRKNQRRGERSEVAARSIEVTCAADHRMDEKINAMYVVDAVGALAHPLGKLAGRQRCKPG